MRLVTADDWLDAPKSNPWWPFLSDLRAAETWVRIAKLEDLKEARR